MRKFITFLLLSAFITLTYAQSYTRSNNNFTQVTTATSDIKTEYTYTIILDFILCYTRNKLQHSHFLLVEYMYIILLQLFWIYKKVALSYLLFY